jgi:phosphoglycolate phosphatase-like HAD superfamily hydrolase
VVGKPAAAFFATALAHLGAGAAHTVMVGDDIETDVLAAQRARASPGSWSRPASICPAPTTTPAAPPTTSLAPDRRHCEDA